MDHTQSIREQIVRDVIDLKKRFRRDHGYMGADPRYACLGYITNSHKGYPLFKRGDEIEGLTVSIDRGNLNGLSLATDLRQ